MAEEIHNPVQHDGKNKQKQQRPEKKRENRHNVGAIINNLDTIDYQATGNSYDIAAYLDNIKALSDAAADDKAKHTVELLGFFITYKFNPELVESILGQCRENWKEITDGYAQPDAAESGYFSMDAERLRETFVHELYDALDRLDDRFYTQKVGDFFSGISKNTTLQSFFFAEITKLYTYFEKMRNTIIAEGGGSADGAADISDALHAINGIIRRIKKNMRVPMTLINDIVETKNREEQARLVEAQFKTLIEHFAATLTKEGGAEIDIGELSDTVTGTILSEMQKQLEPMKRLLEESETVKAEPEAETPALDTRELETGLATAVVAAIEKHFNQAQTESETFDSKETSKAIAKLKDELRELIERKSDEVAALVNKGILAVKAIEDGLASKANEIESPSFSRPDYSRTAPQMPEQPTAPEEDRFVGNLLENEIIGDFGSDDSPAGLAFGGESTSDPMMPASDTQAEILEAIAKLQKETTAQFQTLAERLGDIERTLASATTGGTGGDTEAIGAKCVQIETSIERLPDTIAARLNEKEEGDEEIEERLEKIEKLLDWFRDEHKTLKSRIVTDD